MIGRVAVVCFVSPSSQKAFFLFLYHHHHHYYYEHVATSAIEKKKKEISKSVIYAAHRGPASVKSLLLHKRTHKFHAAWSLPPIARSAAKKPEVTR